MPGENRTHFGSDPDIFWVDARSSDTFTDFIFIAVNSGAVNMLVACFQGNLYCFLNFTSFSLPCAYGITASVWMLDSMLEG